MTGLSIARFHLSRLGRLQVRTVTRWPNGTDDLSPPSARTTAFGALRAQSGSGERKRDSEARDTHKEVGGQGSSLLSSSPGAQEPGLDSRHQEGDTY